MYENILNTKHWHISEDYYNRIGLKAIALLEQGKSIDMLKQQAPTPLLNDAALGMATAEAPFKTIINGDGEQVALIPLYGTMTKDGGLCSYGTAELAQMINQANAMDNIKAIVMDINTPGGASNSTEVLDRAIQKSKKPIVGYVNDLAASAGLWTASSIAAKGKILVDSLQNSSMGSIGTIYFHQNIAAKLMADGVDLEIIRAPQSVDKARVNSVEPLTQELRNEILEQMRGMTDGFIEAVKQNYGGRLQLDTPKLFTGGLFSGKQAIDIGFADEQGDLSQAYNMAIDMANTQTKKSFLMNTSMNMFQKFGLSFSIAQKLSAEELENLSTAAERLGEMESAHAQSVEQNGTLTAQVAGLTTTNAELVEQVETLNTQLAEKDALLEAAPAGQSTTVVTDADQEELEEAPVNKYETSADRQMAEIKSKLQIVKK